MGANPAYLNARRARAIAPAPSTALVVAAPVGGWNARDALGAMNPNDAVTMTNMFPSTTSVDLRKGYSIWATGLDSSQVETIFSYNGPSSNKQFGVTASGKIYETTSGGAVGAADVSGMTNGRFQYINVSTTAGNYLMAVNGADKARFYTGSAWAADGDGSPYDITGVDSATCIQINLFKNMVWLVKSATLDAYYGAAGVIGGAYTKFSLNGIAKLGGYLMAMATWTIDAGYGVDDLAVFITSEGEYIVYRGTDPSSITTWSLVGVWELGAPTGRRCFMKYGGDVAVICEDGLIPLSGALQSSRMNPRVAISDKIQYAMSQAVTSYGAHGAVNFGWEPVYFPGENMLLVNVPINAGSAQQQYVMNTINRSWCNFTGWNANCFAIFNDLLYFGANGFIAKAWTTNADNGAAITGVCLQAFNYYKDFVHPKRFTMMRPVFNTNGSPSVFGTINTDFDLSEPTQALTVSAPSYALWGTGLWGTGLWGNTGISQNWSGVSKVGTNGAATLKIAAAGVSVKWLATTVVYERSRGFL